MFNRGKVVKQAGLFLLLALIVLALGWPLAEILREAVWKQGHLTGSVIAETAAAPGLGAVLLNTAIIIAVSSTLATVIGGVLAVVATKLKLRWAEAFRAIPLVPLTIAPLVGAIGWVFLLAPRTGWINIFLRQFTGGDEGPLNIFTLPGVIFVTTLYIVPYVFATMASALDRINSETFEAFLLNGTGRAGAAFRVVTGVLRPALLAGFILATLEAAIQFSIPLILNVHVLTTSIYDYVQHASPARRDMAATLAVLLVLFGSCLTAAEVMILGRRRSASLGGRGLSQQRWSFGRTMDRALAGIAVLYLVVSALLPLLAILLVSVLPYWKPQFSIAEFTVRHYVRVFGSGNFLDAALNSVKLAAIGVVAVIVISLLISIVRARTRSRIGQLLYVVGNLPLGVPGVVLGLGALILFTTGPIPLYGTLTGLVLAYVIHHLPMALRNIDPIVHQVGKELEEAARVTGAGETRVLADVTIPLVLPGITAAAAVTMILMLREFPMSALLSTPSTKVLSVYLVNSFENGVFPQVAAMAIGLSLVSMLGVIALQVLRSRVKFGKKSPDAGQKDLPRAPVLGAVDFGVGQGSA